MFSFLDSKVQLLKWWYTARPWALCMEVDNEIPCEDVFCFTYHNILHLRRQQGLKGVNFVTWKNRGFDKYRIGGEKPTISRYQLLHLSYFHWCKLFCVCAFLIIAKHWY